MIASIRKRWPLALCAAGYGALMIVAYFSMAGSAGHV